MGVLKSWGPQNHRFTKIVYSNEWDDLGVTPISGTHQNGCDFMGKLMMKRSICPILTHPTSAVGRMLGSKVSIWVMRFLAPGGFDIGHG